MKLYKFPNSLVSQINVLWILITDFLNFLIERWLIAISKYETVVHDGRTKKLLLTSKWYLILDVFIGRTARRDSLSPDAYPRRRNSKSHLSPDRHSSRRDISPNHQRGRLRRQSMSVAGRPMRYLFFKQAF